MDKYRWFVRKRQEWISEMLRVYGFIQRGHLERMFGISTPQASHDLQCFLRENPASMTYDKSRKAYMATNFVTANRRNGNAICQKTRLHASRRDRMDDL